MKLFDEKLCVCEKCDKNLYQNELSCQVVANKMALYSIHDELEKVRENLFKKIAIMHEKKDFFKVKRSICNIIHTESTNIWNILSKPAFFNRLIVVKRKRIFNKGFMYNLNNFKKYS